MLVVLVVGRRGAYRPIVTPPRDSAYHALSRKRRRAEHEGMTRGRPAAGASNRRDSCLLAADSCRQRDVEPGKFAVRESRRRDNGDVPGAAVTDIATRTHILRRFVHECTAESPYAESRPGARSPTGATISGGDAPDLPLKFVSIGRRVSAETQHSVPCENTTTWWTRAPDALPPPPPL